MTASPEVTISLNRTVFNRIITVIKERLEAMFLSACDELPRRNTAFINLGDRREIFNFVDVVLNMFAERPILAAPNQGASNNAELKILINQLLPNRTAVERLVFNAQLENEIQQEVTQLARSSDVMLSNEAYSPFVFTVSVDDNRTFFHILTHRVTVNLQRYYKNLLNDYRRGVRELKDNDHRPGVPRTAVTPDMLDEDFDNLTKQLRFITP